MKKYRLLSVLLVCFFSRVAFSQSWMQMMEDPSVNFYDVQKAFNKSMKKYVRKQKKIKNADHDEKKMPGFMQYKRWEWFVEPRVYPSGDRMQMMNALTDVQEKILSPSLKHSNSVMQAGNWTLLGPTTNIPSGGGGAGRVNCIAFHPSQPNTIFAGAPAGGLWKSTDGGLTWSTNTDNLAVLGISDIAIDPLNPNNMYIATGDGDGGDTYSVGILKSTDGGITWNITGLSFTITSSNEINRLLIHPSNPNILFAATKLGVFRSVDAGASWVKTLNVGSMKDMEFKPGDPNTVYASSITGFYRSLNGGSSFSNITTGLPGSTSVSRLAIAVTPADSNYVYVLAGGNDNGFYGLYRSTNSGGSFTTQATSPNLLGWDANGGDTGGQAWYDLSIAASPTNKDEIVTGGVNVWRSVNGGVSWGIIGHWWGNGAPYVHADVHALSFFPNSGTTIFAGCDGGVFKTTNNGSTWTDYSNGLQIAQMYRLGNSATNSNLVIQGWQDNGTGRWNAGTWSRIYGGDGMECFIDWSDPNYMYCELYYGSFQRSTNGGGNFSSITNGITESGAWVTPWCIDPNVPQMLYGGFENVWKSTNRGNNWSVISNFPTSALINALAVAPSNSNYIYASKGSTLYKTTNGGSSWTNISTGLSGSISYISVSGSDPDRIWVSISGYTAPYKVYKSINGGTSWTNITYDLPNLPASCVVVDTASAKEGIYVATDLGVYYLDSTLTSWLPFNNGLPNVRVDELEIQYSSGKLRAATYGRGLWETGLYNPASLLPSANFSADVVKGCPGMSVQFSDMSTGNATSWNWTFPGGNPASSALQNPVVVYNNAGTYNDVKLVATNASGSDSVIKYSHIAVSPANVPTTNPAGSVTICGSNTLIYSSYGTTYKWLPNGQTNNFINTTLSGAYSVIVTDMFGCKDTSAPVNVTFFPLPATPTVAVNADTLISTSAVSYQWYFASAIIPGATSQTHVAMQTGSYYVVITDTNGCTKQSPAVNVVVTGVEETDIPGLSMSISPSPNNGNFNLYLFLSEKQNVSVDIVDVAGKQVCSKHIGEVSGAVNETFMRDLGKGMYFLILKTESGNESRKFVVQ